MNRRRSTDAQVYIPGNVGFRYDEITKMHGQVIHYGRYYVDDRRANIYN